MNKDTCTYPPCGKELKHIEGRRKKKYCDAKCKLKHWQLLNPVKKELKTKRIPLKEWEEMKKKMASMIDYTPPPIFTSKENIEKFNKAFEKECTPNPPTTLDELKAFCPFEKGTDEFRLWVQTERQKYGI